MITCEFCALFTFDIPDGQKVGIQKKEPTKGVHGWCKGAPGHPSHTEHKDSIRCVWFVKLD